MRKLAVWPWLAITVLWSLPFLALMAVGGWWLWQNQLLLLWLSVSCSCSGIAWIVARMLKRRRKKPFVAKQGRPEAFCSPLDKQAWSDVQTLSEQLRQDQSLSYVDTETWLDIGRRVLGVVAKHYRVGARHPELDIPMTKLLGIVEHVSHDLRRQMSANLPFSHVITLADGLNFQRWLDHFKAANTVLRLGRMLVNPLSGFLNEARSHAQDSVLDLTLPHLQHWLLDAYIQKVGEYAILLYSGRLAVDAEKIEALSPKSLQDHKQALEQQESLEREPLRILVAGQTNAGKSTLINTLFDKPVAAVDALSCTAELLPYKLEREGLLSGLIFDTPGYGEQSDWLEDNKQVLDATDLLLVVCAVNNAARSADKRFLDAFQQHFLAQPTRKQPPIDYGGGDEIDEAYFIVLPYMKGGNLRNFLRGRAFCPVPVALPLLSQIAHAIDFSHSSGVIHGDIKPENILLDEEHNTAFLSDFGVSRHFDTVDKMIVSARVGSLSGIQRGGVGGTSAYLSPEQLSDNLQTPKSDIYSFGLVAYEFLTGRLPFDLTAPLYRQVHARVAGNLTPPEQANPGIAPRIASALRCVLNSNPDERPATAVAFVSMLKISKKWDIFIAHATPDKSLAEALYDALSGRQQVFLDSKCLRLGDDWDSELASAQRDALVTVILVSPHASNAYYAREEIACAIKMAREDPRSHRVVPIFLTTDLLQNPPYGLALKHGLLLEDTVTLQSVSDELTKLVQSLM